MSRLNRMHKISITVFMVIVIVSMIALSIHLNITPVVELKITTDMDIIKVGESVQLEFVGYTKDGELATEKQMEKLDLQWRCTSTSAVKINNDGTYSPDNILIIDENGKITAVRKGNDNAQLFSARFELYSRPITVYVMENE